MGRRYYWAEDDGPIRFGAVRRPSAALRLTSRSEIRMPFSPRRRLPILAVLLAALVLPATPAAAADPTLGDAITLPDGSVLPPMPADQIRPSAQAEMLAEHGGALAAQPRRRWSRWRTPAAMVQVAEPLTVAASRCHRAGRTAPERAPPRGARLPAVLEARHDDARLAAAGPRLDDRVLQRRRAGERLPGPGLVRHAHGRMDRLDVVGA